MNDTASFVTLSPTDYANFLPAEQILDFAIKPLWDAMPRIAGPAFTVQLSPGEHLMLHAAIHEAPAGSVLVVDAGGDTSFAVAGGNVCAIAQRNGIAAMVIDGVIRDLAEIRENRFPVFARGVVPIPGKKNIVTPLNQLVRCGGVAVQPDDIVVGDEEGVVVVPRSQSVEVFKRAKERADEEANTSLQDWGDAHRAKVQKILEEKA